MLGVLSYNEFKVKHMEKSISSLMPSPWQRDAAETLDKAVHGHLAKASMGTSPISMTLAYADWALHLAASPGRQMLLAQEATALFRQSLTSPLQQPPVDADGKPVQEKDARFSDSGWNQWPFNAMKNRFKASDTWWSGATQVDGVSRHNQHIVSFFTRQWLDAMSPSNWMTTNPEVLRKGRESQGQSWLKGFQSYVKDMQEQQNKRITTGPGTLAPLEFEVGKDVALTPGKVVFRNHLIELIQYTPTTAKVYPEPLLIVPSCIMKFYILDLSPSNSMVRYLVSQGHTVFMISWRNPEASDRELSLQDYVHSGVMQAMAAVKEGTGAPRIHAMGYCLGGTFLAIAAAALGRSDTKAPAAPHKGSAGRDNLPKLATVTLLAAQTDFSEPGELGVFIDDDQLKNLREEMARTGFLSGRQMAGSFQFLHSRDLIWSRNTRRYLLGQDEVGSDLMSWNADVTRLPERMHIQSLSSFYLNNELATGHYRLDSAGVVSLKDITAPMLVVGTVRDHVSPWQSVYKINYLTDTHLTFVLASGGHNAGIVSEPGHPHRSYQIDSVEKNHRWIEPGEWVAKAALHEGSWWPAMHAWLNDRSGKPVLPPVIDPANVVCEAPGDYVMVRYAD